MLMNTNSSVESVINPFSRRFEWDLPTLRIFIAAHLENDGVAKGYIEVGVNRFHLRFHYKIFIILFKSTKVIHAKRLWEDTSIYMPFCENQIKIV